MRKIKLISAGLILSMALLFAPSVHAEPVEETSTEVTSEAQQSEDTTEAATEVSEEVTSEETTGEATEDATATDAPTEETTEATTSGRPSYEGVQSITQTTSATIKTVDFTGTIVNLDKYKETCASYDITPENESIIKLGIAPTDGSSEEIEISLYASKGFDGMLGFVQGKEYTITVKEKSDVIESVDILPTITLEDDSELKFEVHYKMPTLADKPESLWIKLLKNNMLFIILLIGCGIGLFVVDYKKRNAS